MKKVVNENLTLLDDPSVIYGQSGQRLGTIQRFDSLGWIGWIAEPFDGREPKQFNSTREAINYLLEVNQ